MRTGTWVYPLDDTYIHLTMARNWAETGVPGIRPGEFAAASSSIAWPALLALAGRLAGTYEMIPLLLNLLVATGFLFWASHVFMGNQRPQAPMVPLTPSQQRSLDQSLTFAGVGCGLMALLILSIAVAGVQQFVFGPKDQDAGIPLFLFFFWVAACAMFLRRQLRRPGSTFNRGMSVSLALMILLLAIPLPALVLSGMEHVLHMTVTAILAVMVLRARPVRGFRPNALRSIGWFLAAALAVSARYESFALLVPLSVVVAFRVGGGASLAIMAGALAPPIAWGRYALSHGWMAVPNPILLKAGFAEERTLFALFMKPTADFYNRLLGVPHILFPCLLLLLSVLLRPKRGRGNQVETRVLYLLLTVATVWMHLSFSSVGNFYRYEAWVLLLILLGLVRNFLLDRWMMLRAKQMISLQRHPLNFLAGILLLILFMMPLAIRGVSAWIRSGQVPHDRWMEHLPPAEFLRKHYAGRTVVANDIGLIGFRSGVRLLDFHGLGSLEPLRHRTEDGEYTTAHVRDWMRRENAEIAVLQSEWWEVKSRVPPEWIRVCDWYFPRNLVFGDHTVSFYALRPEHAEPLRTALRMEVPFLPEGLKVNWKAPPPP